MASLASPVALAVSVEHAVDAAALRADRKTALGQVRHDQPGSHSFVFGLVACEKDPFALFFAEAVPDVAVAALASIDAITLTSKLSALSVKLGPSTPSSWVSSRARAALAMPSSNMSRALLRSSGKVNRLRPHPRKPKSFLRRLASQKPAATALLQPLPGFSPCGAAPV